MARTRSRATAKKVGSTTERQVADYLAAALDDDRIDRRVKTGGKDKGDIAGVRAHGERVVIEVKAVRHEDCTKCRRQSGLALPEWTNEAHTEAGNDDALVGAVILKRTGTQDPGRYWAVMTVDDLLAFITGQRHGHRLADAITTAADPADPVDPRLEQVMRAATTTAQHIATITGEAAP
ncbi:PDDEXK family nuclease [Mycolicibacterium sphagni]|uniref:hypothetical protein n=1 Tax=Mycolicibacterium sphagni TaxID=1786 RepID=UPI0021F351AC|nr:hypothetical protein [Mycolicibacterium sphagni]